MTRSRRIVALVRVLLVAVCLCFLGAARSHAQDIAPDAAAYDPRAPQPDHATAVDLPDPGAALTEERDEDPQSGEEGDTKPPPRASDVTPSTPDRRGMMARGPPVDPRSVAHRPRSSRGPPPQV